MATADTTAETPPNRFTARCYCGAHRLVLEGAPQAVAYCHCADCRRWTGAPVAAFVAFEDAALRAEPPLGTPLVMASGATRWHCPRCGSPLAARFEYLPGQVYVPLGLLDNASDVPPQVHCHTDERLPWLHIADGLDRMAGSGLSQLAPGNDIK